MTPVPNLSIWTIYRKPKDHPDKYVGRMFSIEPHNTIPVVYAAKPTRYILLGDSLDEVRNQLPLGLFNLGRQPGDDTIIVESWV